MRVVMVGPDARRGQGGMATVAATLLRHGGARVELRCVPTHSDGSVAHRLRVWLLGSARVFALLAARRVDLLHVHVSERGSVLRKSVILLAADLARVPVLLHCHGAQFFDWYATLPGLAQRAIRHVFGRAAQVVVLGEPSRRRYLDVLGLDPARVVVERNAVTLPAAVPARAEGEVGVVFLGRFGPRKGSADVLRAVAALPEDARDRVRLRMAGDGEVAETVALARELGVAAEITGWLSPAERDATLAAAQIFVLPSRQEELPMALLEAMGWGLAPVVTPVGSIPDVLTDEQDALLITPGDRPGLTKALDRMISSAEDRSRIGAAARQRALSFDATEYCARMARRWVSLARG